MLLVQNLGVYFAGRYLFENVSFRINKGNRVGLVGKNGAGKSTLLKILAKSQQSSEGEVVYEGDVTIGYLSQDIDFVQGRTVWQEADSAFEQLVEIQERIDFVNKELAERTDYESDEYGKLIEDISHLTERFGLLGGYTKDAEIEQILIGLGFKNSDFHRSTEEFSGGWRMRIELAKLLLQRHDVMLLDEPTNHLDIDSIVWLEDFLKDYPGAVVLVSHDRQFLDNVTNRTIEIANRHISDFKANYTRYLELREDRREKLEQAQKNQEQMIKHTEDLISKFRAKANKASMAQSLIKKLDKIERIEIENDDVTKMNIRFVDSVQPGKIIFELDDVGVAFGDHQVFDHVSFYVNRGEKVAFVGQNGQGKTTLSRAIINEQEHSGKIKHGHNVEIGYFAQNQAHVLNDKLTVLEEAENSATEETRKHVRDYLGAFMFGGEAVEKKVSVLSGGERNRLALCKLLLRPFNVLIMDEPTNHLDIVSKELLKKALQKYSGTLILVSHDREFLEGLVDKVFDFRNGQVKEYLSGIDDYLAQIKAGSFREVEKGNSLAAPKEEKPIEVKIEQEKRVLSFEEEKEQKRLKNRLSRIETEISDLETKISDLENKLHSGSQTQQELDKYSNLKNDLDKKMLEWEEVSEQII
ncbi:ABC-F family ATP-binding cassette domain-containing protein [Empedobacter falsenii]|uniref:ABC-F family ATP-binding cassette domain-containing protein n=1 Tax=Empedobacter falsenii TaxID=343874 RepID=UPI002574A862|nr:ABC-F family ATP-binding cassette domain-containing protein [Empedobacter falsenii]MDM1297781.1 ABC-F family ATP-binding cassette domain-containing protein [Empedobacter falsenii]MDM1317589.1 ABC-F family ATP-binding cassette domain-containing protein [Empedobacter falsenii]